MSSSLQRGEWGRAGAPLSAGLIASQFRVLNGEMWLARRLGKRGLLSEEIVGGLTDAVERKRRLRHAISYRGLAEVRCAPSTTYRQAFERLYGERL